MEAITKSKGREIVSGQDWRSSGAYPVFGLWLSLLGVVQSRVDADEVTGRHADATVGNFHGKIVTPRSQTTFDPKSGSFRGLMLLNEAQNMADYLTTKPLRVKVTFTITLIEDFQHEKTRRCIVG